MKAAFPAALQDFTALGLPAITPAPVIVQSPPGGGDEPKKQRKPVRPVWDRAPGDTPAVEPAPVAAEVEAAPQVAAVTPGKPDLTNLARVLLPPVPAPRTDTPQPKKPADLSARFDATEDADTSTAAGLVAVNGSGQGTDTDDTSEGRAQATVAGFARLAENNDRCWVFTPARGDLREDADTLTATAQWDDDELALAVLMLADDDET